MHIPNLVYTKKYYFNFFSVRIILKSQHKQTCEFGFYRKYICHPWENQVIEKICMQINKSIRFIIIPTYIYLDYVCHHSICGKYNNMYIASHWEAFYLFFLLQIFFYLFYKKKFDKNILLVMLICVVVCYHTRKCQRPQNRKIGVWLHINNLVPS